MASSLVEIGAYDSLEASCVESRRPLTGLLIESLLVVGSALLLVLIKSMVEDCSMAPSMATIIAAEYECVIKIEVNIIDSQ